MSAKPDYERSTTATTLERLPEPLRSAFLERAESALLTLPGDSPAFLTHSRRLRRVGPLARMMGGDRDAEHLTALVIGPRDVLVGTHGEHRGTAVLAARLEDVDTSSLAERLGGQAGVLAADGMTVTGFPVSVEGATGRGSFHVGLGPPAGDHARSALQAAMRQAKA